MILVLRSIARQIEGREASSVFRELMAPEIAIRLVLPDPEFVHISQQIELSEGGEEGRDRGPGVGRNGRARGGASGGIGGGEGVVLSTGRLLLSRLGEEGRGGGGEGEGYTLDRNIACSSHYRNPATAHATSTYS
jgi:hypothetical protein